MIMCIASVEGALLLFNHRVNVIGFGRGRADWKYNILKIVSKTIHKQKKRLTKFINLFPWLLSIQMLYLMDHVVADCTGKRTLALLLACILELHIRNTLTLQVFVIIYQ